MKCFIKWSLGLIVLTSYSATAQFIINNGIPITNSAYIITNGDWQNNGSVRNDGTIFTTQTWVNTGTFDNASTGGFIIDFSNDDNFQAGSNTAYMGFFEKRGARDLLLTGSIMVKNVLTLKSGQIKIESPQDSLMFRSSATVIAEGGALVNGPMARSGAGSFTFPVGIDGYSMPVKFQQANSAWIGVKLEPAPGGLTSGEGVTAVTGFPYVWQVTKANATDTVQYIEVQVPDVLAPLTNGVVARRTSENQLEGLGLRVAETVGPTKRYRSYVGGLKGAFTLAQGYAFTTLNDSIELAKLFEFTGGNNWTKKANWLQGTSPITTWQGITVKGGRVTSVILRDANIVGTIPASFTNVAALQTLDVANNFISTIPIFTSMPAITTVNVSNNKLQFKDLEDNQSLIVVDKVDYANQKPVTDPTYNELPVNSDTTMTVTVAGTKNKYQWYRNGVAIPGATADTYIVDPINRSTMGDYVLEITNEVIADTLYSSVHTVEATANISGKLKFGANNVQAGRMQLLRVTEIGSKYDTIRFDNQGNRVISGGQAGVAVSSTGDYSFKKVLLRDYVVNGFPDISIAAYERTVPTWYTQSIYWEEADTLELADNIPVVPGGPGLDITAVTRPDDPTGGQGFISGTFYEDIPEDGRVTAKGRVKGSPVTVRRVERAGRGKDEVLSLVAYTFTNELGVFNFSALDAGDVEYRLNLQYPGYPMDEDSYITILLKENIFDRQVGVEAEVIAGKINVRKLIITGWEEEVHSMTAYPNPTAEYVYIKGKAQGQVQFKLMDSNGRMLGVNTRWDEARGEHELDVRQLKPGTYFLGIATGSKVEQLRIVVK
jgi:hypothetical protein